MAGCSADTFGNVTPSVFACLVQKAADQGVTISGNSGTAGKSGFKFQWNYDPGASSLTIKCLDKPPLIVSCATVKGKVREIVEGCGGR
jgi:hypothetical protein